jgi:crotonobetainyl-CoA:carnitine CoA-transferase CaiB-like acyl-CoA transferase
MQTSRRKAVSAISAHHPAEGRPLEGVRVVDLSGSYAGPTATMYLADLGATVIKIERPGTGDDARGWGPPFVDGTSAWFAGANRNKAGVVLDLRHERAQEVLRRLLDEADVLVANLNPRKLHRRGLAPDQVMRRHPHLVYCALSGFGLTGPDAALPGYDLVAQARSGLMSVTGERGGMPQRTNTALSDIAAALVAAVGILAALRRKERTGRGDVVDVSLLDADLALMAPRISSFLAGEPEPAPSGGTDSVIAVYQPFETADRPIVIAAGNDAVWARLCAVVGLPELLADPRYADNEGRRRHRDEIVAVLAQELLKRPAADWLADLSASSVPAARIASLSEVVKDPHVDARGAVRSVVDGRGTVYPVVAAPWRLASQPDVPMTAPPELGADTRGVLAAHGFTDAEIEDLFEEGVVWEPLTTST